MLSIEEEFEQRFREETGDLLYQRVLAVLLVGIILIPFFSVLDYVVVREHFNLFFLYRITCSALLLVLLFIYFTRFGRKHAYGLVTLAYVIAAFTISMMCVKMGGYPSFYYVGMIMVLVTVVILPLSTLQTAMYGVLVYLIYAVPIVLFTRPSAESLKIFFSNSFFLCFTLSVLCRFVNDFDKLFRIFFDCSEYDARIFFNCLF